jgi:electron transfer flavoprotein beta subunit
MKIAVCVKHVPTGTLRLLPDSHRLDRSGPGELNTCDKNAIEEALRIKSDAGGDVVVVSMGPDAATESLRTALAMGADRAVLVNDDAAAGADLVATTKVLAAVLEREMADLVLFGQQANDGSGAVLWAAVADRLRLPFVSQAASIALDGDSVRVTRETEFGDDVIDAQLPAVVSVSDTINEPRYTSLKGMMGAKKKPLDVLTLTELGLDAGSGGAAGSMTEVRGVAKPSGRANSIKVVDDGNAAQTILDYLVDKQLV